MVKAQMQISRQRQRVSVLALSSRFDGPIRVRLLVRRLTVSVLALSSRFDGRYT